MAPSKAKEEENDSLVTPTSLALSLSPPRAPPLDSAHRVLLLGQNPFSAYSLHHDHNQATSLYHLNLRKRVMELLHKSHSKQHFRMPHPHLPVGPELGDQITRALGVLLPVPWVNSVRDSGGFRRIVDGLVTLSAPSLALSSPSAARDFVHLTRRCARHRYGPHPMHVLDLFFPHNRNSKTASHVYPRGLLVFVHGGAWGSGLPWMYRLIAEPFLEDLSMAVAIVGYRTYPDAHAMGQVQDVEQALLYVKNKYPSLCNPDETPLGTCLMGHSSGAHISLLMLVRRVERRIREDATRDDNSIQFSSFVGLSGPYDISHHFDYEAARGVEELSPMKPACGYTREDFRRNSPAQQLLELLTHVDEHLAPLQSLLPRILLLHGIEDSTVPFTSTAEASRILRSCGITDCDEVYVAQTGHQDTVMHFMLGGKSRELVIEWLKHLRHTRQTVAIDSKL